MSIYLIFPFCPCCSSCLLSHRGRMMHFIYILLLMQCVACYGGVWTLQRVAPKMQAQLHMNVNKSPSIERTNIGKFVEYTSFSIDVGVFEVPLHLLLDKTLQSNSRYHMMVAENNIFISTAARLLGWNNHAFRYSARHNTNSSTIELEYSDMSSNKQPLLVQVHFDIDEYNILHVTMQHTKGPLSKKNLYALLKNLELALRENLEHSLKYLQMRHQKQQQLLQETSKSIQSIQKQQLERTIAPECRSLKVDRSHGSNRMMTMRQMRRQSPPVCRSS